MLTFLMFLFLWLMFWALPLSILINMTLSIFNIAYCVTFSQSMCICFWITIIMFFLDNKEDK